MFILFSSCFIGGLALIITKFVISILPFIDFTNPYVIGGSMCFVGFAGLMGYGAATVPCPYPIYRGKEK